MVSEQRLNFIGGKRRDKCGQGTFIHSVSATYIYPVPTMCQPLVGSVDTAVNKTDKNPVLKNVLFIARGKISLW